MKKIVVFTVALILLIACEYYLLNEIFTRKRLPIMASTLVGVLLCIFVFLRFFKRTVTTS